MMKKILFLILFTFHLLSPISSQTHSKEYIYQDFGVWSYNIDNDNMISVKAYVTRTRIIEYSNSEIKKNTVPSLPLFKYELFMVSNSIHNGEKTSTWLYETKIFIDGDEVTKDQFPNGFLVSINTEPTLIYWHESVRSDVKFKVRWDNSVHEPRNLK